MRVALFVTCLNDTLFPRAGQATVEVLERLGHEVVFPFEQTCCGQMHLNSGYGKEAVPLMERFVSCFSEEEVIVSPSGSCVATVREQYPKLSAEYGDPALAAEMARLAPRVHEFSELLTDVLGLEDVGAGYPHVVTYHPSCHGLRSLRLGDRPLRLLRAVRGLTLVEAGGAEECCGFGGSFAVKNAETSTAMLTEKIRQLLDTRAEVCVAGDSSCLMHIGGGLARLRAGMRTAHLAEVLASSPDRATRIAG
ncbi:MAG: (Fe-S)-binding protein [Solirubrobacterales bacterium]